MKTTNTTERHVQNQDYRARATTSTKTLLIRIPIHYRHLDGRPRRVRVTHTHTSFGSQSITGTSMGGRGVCVTDGLVDGVAMRGGQSSWPTLPAEGVNVVGGG